MSTFWITIAVEDNNLREADKLACAMAEDVQGRVIQVDHEPPQGSTIVGDFNEDGVR